MNIETWLAYVAATVVISLIPGPSVFMVLGQTLARGLKAAAYCVVGDVCGGVIVMTASYAGLGVILASSSEAFFVLKWAGVAYMAWLGYTQIKSARQLREGDLKEIGLVGHRSASLQAGFLTGILNPKAIMFYMAFLVQFMNPKLPMTPQFLILMATSCMVVFSVLFGYALLAAQARRQLKSLRARKSMGYAGGSFLLGGSALMASTR